LAAVAVGVAVLGYQSYEIRKWRREKIEELALATEVWSLYYPKRSWESVETAVQRCGLMGRTRSVKTDLEYVREWHGSHNYRGGLVLRDLSLPLFREDLRDEEQDTDDSTTKARSPPNSFTWTTIQDLLMDPTRLARRRECYYLYYEITGDGQQKQQIFCRGTTILMDVLTCLEAWMSHDPELRCRIHRGFGRQADRILEDVVPLLAPPADRRATIEVCGHSLGGAVAVILAAKLRKRGYRVVRVTTAGSPRFCATEADAQYLLGQLPADYLRIEHELDFVPFLPPFGAHIGNKLWLLRGTQPRFVTKENDSWADSVWYNFLAWDILRSKGAYHRVPCYTVQLMNSFND
jgi:pimeloyl-ACP methyl ester carboxylesterase